MDVSSSPFSAQKGEGTGIKSLRQPCKPRTLSGQRRGGAEDDGGDARLLEPSAKEFV